jgi:Predicted hydrolases or acyltransferases (alpha/beta hydrolase superfamily)
LFIKLGNLRVHYKVAGTGAPLLLLHGWGCNVEHYAKLYEHLAKRFTTYAIDLPGFGLSTVPEKVWGAAEYADLIAQFIGAMNINNPILIGHSLGGKIIINLVAQNLVKVKKIVLISSAGVRLPRKLGVILKIYLFKIVKFFAKLPVIRDVLDPRLELYKNKFGSVDYRSAKGPMRSILVKVVNEDITALLPQIKVPTLLLWGDKDTSAPLAAGKIMQQMINGAVLKVFPGSGHFPFLDNYEKVIMELDEFLE